jgi:class 3 adenylate cyclase/tetratricopeptide (TPR) repeat protein
VAGSARSGRELATVLFVDVVDSTDLVAALGDERWIEVLDALEAATAEAVLRGAGELIKSTGDGSLSVFPTPSAAIDCATSLHERAGSVGIELRAGVHTGEIEWRGDDIAGIAVHVAARLVGIASPGHTFVSDTVRTLAAGASYPFEARGERRVKGIAEPLVVYALGPGRDQAGEVPDGPRRGSALEQLGRLLVAGRFEDAAGPAATADDAGAVADAVLDARARTGFLDVDMALVRLLENVLERLPADEASRRARIAAKLAFELRGDQSTLDRRRQLLLDAGTAAADDRARCDVGRAALNAMWDPAGARDRVRSADDLIPVARRLGDVEAELEARLARVHALIEMGRVDDAELELATYARLAAPLRRDDLQAFVASRRAVVANVRGRFDEVDRQAELARAAAVAAAMPDADRLWMSLRSATLVHRSESRADVEAALPMLRDHIVEFPGNLFEASMAWALHGLGRLDEAANELARVVPKLVRSSGHRWLSAAVEAAHVAADVGTDAQCAALYDVLVDKQDLFVLLGPRFLGAVRQYLGPLAARIGRQDEAIGLLERAIADLDEMAALPWAAMARASLADVVEPDDPLRAGALRDEARATARALGMTRLLESMDAHASSDRDATTVWRLRRDDDGSWMLDAGGERVRLRPSRGVDHLWTLLANPRRDVAAIDLEAGEGAAPAGASAEMIDQQAIDSYRRRLVELDADLDAADRSGDQARAATLEAERDELLTHVRAAVGLGGRRRRLPDASERARVNVTRAIKRAIDQVAQSAPVAGLHLSRSVRTGTFCRYDPDPSGPERWEL